MISLAQLVLDQSGAGQRAEVEIVPAWQWSSDHLSLGKRTVARAGLVRLRADVERVHGCTGVAA